MLKKSWTVFLKPASGQCRAHPFHISPNDHGQYRVAACYWQGTSDPGFTFPGTYLVAPKRKHTRKEVEVLIEFYLCATAASYTKKGL